MDFRSRTSGLLGGLAPLPHLIHNQSAQARHDGHPGQSEGQVGQAHSLVDNQTHSCPGQHHAEEQGQQRPGETAMPGGGRRRRRRLQLAAHAHDHHGDVVRTAAQVGQVHQKTACLGRRQDTGDGSQFAVAHLAAETIAAQQKHIPLAEWVNALDVDGHEWFGTQGSKDDVAGNPLDGFRVHVLAAGVFPNHAVVEAELLHLTAADAVSPAVADMSHPGTVRAQHQGGGRCPHALELTVLLSTGMDTGIGLDERLAQGGSGSLAGVLVIGVGNDPNGQGTGQFDPPRGHPCHPPPGTRVPGTAIVVRQWPAGWRGCPGYDCGGLPRRSDWHAGYRRTLSHFHAPSPAAERESITPVQGQRVLFECMLHCFPSIAKGTLVERGAWSVEREAWSVERGV